MKESDRVTPYDRWYVVDLPGLDLSFVTTVDEHSLPSRLEIDDRLTGTGISKIEGDGELGYGKINLISYWDKSAKPAVMYAKETFEDGSIMYFKTVPLVGLENS